MVTRWSGVLHYATSMAATERNEVILSEGNGLQDTKLLTDKNQRGVSHRDCYQRPEIRQN